MKSDRGTIFTEIGLKLRAGLPLTPLELFFLGMNRGARFTYEAIGWTLAFIIIAGALSLGCGLGLALAWSAGRAVLAAVTWLWVLS